MTEIVEDCRALALALAATPVQDVPIFFTYAPYNYKESVKKIPVFIINDVSYFYIRRKVKINDRLLKTCHDLIRSLLPLTYTTVKVGYFNDFFDFRSYSQPPEVLENPEVMAENAGAIKDALSNIPELLDPTTRHLYQMAFKGATKPNLPKEGEPPIKKKKYRGYNRSYGLPIPTLSHSDQSDEAIRQWNIIRNYAYHGRDPENPAISFPLLSDATIETPEILAHLLRYQYTPNYFQPGEEYKNKWMARNGLTNPVLNEQDRNRISYEFGCEAVVLLAQMVHYDVRTSNDISRYTLRHGPPPRITQGLLYTTNYQDLLNHGFGHHDTIFQSVVHRKINIDFNAPNFGGTISLEDRVLAADRYPFFLTKVDIPELSIQTRHRFLKTLAFEFTNANLLEVVMADPEITGSQKAYIMSLFCNYYSIQKMYPTKLHDAFVRNVNIETFGIAGAIGDHELVMRLMNIYNQYIGLHPHIDSCIQHKLNTLFGFDIKRLMDSRVLKVAPVKLDDTITTELVKVYRDGGRNHLYLKASYQDFRLLKQSRGYTYSLKRGGREYNSTEFVQLFDLDPNAIPYLMYDDTKVLFGEATLRPTEGNNV